MAFPSFAWKYVPSSGVPNPPRCLSPGLSGAGLWGALGCAPLAEVGECGACSGRACGVLRARVPGVCLQMGPEGSHRRASGVSSERQRSLICSLRLPVWIPQAFPLASACPPPSRAPLVLGLGARRRERRPFWGSSSALNLLHRMEQDYPLNLSISLSGGKETNRDAPSNGE